MTPADRAAERKRVLSIGWHSVCDTKGMSVDDLSDARSAAARAALLTAGFEVAPPRAMKAMKVMKATRLVAHECQCQLGDYSGS